jgi:hypothetical protein
MQDITTADRRNADRLTVGFRFNQTEVEGRGPWVRVHTRRSAGAPQAGFALAIGYAAILRNSS